MTFLATPTCVSRPTKRKLSLRVIELLVCGDKYIYAPAARTILKLGTQKGSVIAHNKQKGQKLLSLAGSDYAESCNWLV